MNARARAKHRLCLYVAAGWRALYADGEITLRQLVALHAESMADARYWRGIPYT